MDELHGHGSFAYGRSNALHGPVPHVAGNEDSGGAAFQKEWVSSLGPASGPLALPHHIRTCEDVPVPVPFHHTLEDWFMVNPARIVAAARELAAY